MKTTRPVGAMHSFVARPAVEHGLQLSGSRQILIRGVSQKLAAVTYRGRYSGNNDAGEALRAVPGQTAGQPEFRMDFDNRAIKIKQELLSIMRCPPANGKHAWDYLPS